MPMPPAHGANPPLSLQAATSSLMPEASHPLSSNAPNWTLLPNSFTE